MKSAGGRARGGGWKGRREGERKGECKRRFIFVQDTEKGRNGWVARVGKTMKRRRDYETQNTPPSLPNPKRSPYILVPMIRPSIKPFPSPGCHTRQLLPPLFRSRDGRQIKAWACACQIPPFLLKTTPSFFSHLLTGKVLLLPTFICHGCWGWGRKAWPPAGSNQVRS